MEKNISKGNKLNEFKELITGKQAPVICLGLLVVFALVAILVSILAFSLPIVPVCIFVVLEAALAAFLNRIQLWIHGLVFIAQIVCGIIASQVVFMILMVCIYVLSILFLHVWSLNE